MKRTSWPVVERLGAAVAVFVLSAVLGGAASPAVAVDVHGVGLQTVRQFVAEDASDSSDSSTDEPSDDASDSSDSSDDTDNSDASDSSDDATDEPTDEPTDDPSASYTDPSSNGEVEMPTGTDDTATTDEPASNNTLGWALVGGGLLAAVAAFVVYRRTS